MNKTQPNLAPPASTSSTENVQDFLEKCASRHPDRVAIYRANLVDLRRFIQSPHDRGLAEIQGPATVIDHEKVTFRELHELVGRAAHGFQCLGVQAGDRALIFLPMSMQLYVAMLALQRIGAQPVLPEPGVSHRHLDTMARVLEPRVIVTVEKTLLLTTGNPNVSRIPIQVSVGPISRLFSGRFEDLLSQELKATPVAVNSSEAALIMVTPAETPGGDPGFVSYSHQDLAAQLYVMNECLPYQESDVDLSVSQVFFLNNLLSGVSTIAPAINLAMLGTSEARVLLAQLQSCGGTTTTLSSSVVRVLSEYSAERRIELPGLRRIVISDTPLNEADVNQLQAMNPETELRVLNRFHTVEPKPFVLAR